MSLTMGRAVFSLILLLLGFILIYSSIYVIGFSNGILFGALMLLAVLFLCVAFFLLIWRG